MRVFELESKLHSDDCAIVNKELMNKSVNDYNLYNSFFTSDCKEDNSKMYNFAFDNPNLHFRDGYGYTNACVVDADSVMRNDSKLTHDKSKIQLCARWDQAVPDLGRGGLIPNLESRLKNGEDTSMIRACNKVTEKDFDRFTPLVGCVAPTIQNSSHIILPFTRGGDITRNYIYSDSYLEKCGFKNNGQFYERVGNAGAKEWKPVTERQTENKVPLTIGLPANTRQGTTEAVQPQIYNYNLL